jgi:hypothetical protein
MLAARSLVKAPEVVTVHHAEHITPATPRTTGVLNFSVEQVIGVGRKGEGLEH